MTPTQKAAIEQLIDTLETYVGFIEDAHILEGQFHWLGGANNAIAAGRAALAETAEPVAGWKLVPVEPTREMWHAVNKLDDQCAAGSYDGKGCSIEQAWDCLLANAPQPPAPAVECDCEELLEFAKWFLENRDGPGTSMARAAIAAHEQKGQKP